MAKVGHHNHEAQTMELFGLILATNVGAKHADKPSPYRAKQNIEKILILTQDSQVVRHSPHKRTTASSILAPATNFRSSSVVERFAVNEDVAGSNPASGAKP